LNEYAGQADAAPRSQHRLHHCFVLARHISTCFSRMSATCQEAMPSISASAKDVENLSIDFFFEGLCCFERRFRNVTTLLCELLAICL
jgi:hypothetical protein